MTKTKKPRTPRNSADAKAIGEILLACAKDPGELMRLVRLVEASRCRKPVGDDAQRRHLHGSAFVLAELGEQLLGIAPPKLTRIDWSLAAICAPPNPAEMKRREERARELLAHEERNRAANKLEAEQRAKRDRALLDRTDPARASVRQMSPLDLVLAEMGRAERLARMRGSSPNAKQEAEDRAAFERKDKARREAARAKRSPADETTEMQREQRERDPERAAAQVRHIARLARR